MKAVFFTVADPQKGLGHLYRCDALANALLTLDIETLLVVDSREGIEWLSQRSPHTPFVNVPWTTDSKKTEEYIDTFDLVIVDSYEIDSEVWQILQDRSRKLIVFDDIGTRIPKSGVLINGSPGSVFIEYPKNDCLKLLLGLKYQVLREPFWNAPVRDFRKEVKSIAVMLGGTDHRGLMKTILSELRSILPPGIHLYAIGVDPKAISIPYVHATGRLSASDVKKLFDSLDLVVTAGGQSVAEAISCELMPVLVSTAENQVFNLRGWHNIGVPVCGSVIDDGWIETLKAIVIKQIRDPKVEPRLQELGRTVRVATMTLARDLVGPI
jgi:UDP-2,4-diacetamido-2,4,6-trideoxy-beta-L-altropyranose hydrolase